MENHSDLLERLGPDTSTCVFSYIDDPADLVRASAVSRSWRQFVIANGFVKSLCQKIYPEVSLFTHTTEITSLDPSQEVASGPCTEWRTCETDHRIYTYLTQCLISTIRIGESILHPVGASSTDNMPDESIENTLEPEDRTYFGPSYWSSCGQADPTVPESLTYRLCSDLCIVDEIRIQPFKAYFQAGHPIYSAKSVRFRMGYFKKKLALLTELYFSYANEADLTADKDFVWSYVSPEFPMSQENVLQSFKLPRPVLCIGGILKIDLLGRVQTQSTDNLYYICVCHVQVIGRPLWPVLSADIPIYCGHDSLGIKYFHEARSDRSASTEGAVSAINRRERSLWRTFAGRIRRFEEADGWNTDVVNALLSPWQFSEDGSDDEETVL